VGGINQTILTGLGFKVFKLIYFTLEKDMGTFLSTIQFICNTQTSKGKKKKKKEKKKHLASCLLASERASFVMYNNFLIFSKEKIMDVARRILWEKKWVEIIRR
jgi:hypothetical protein